MRGTGLVFFLKTVDIHEMLVDALIKQPHRNPRTAASKYSKEIAEDFMKQGIRGIQHKTELRPIPKKPGQSDRTCTKSRERDLEKAIETQTKKQQI